METRKEVVEESDAAWQSDVESGSPAESLSVGGDTETGLDDEASKDDATGDDETSDTDENTENGETARKRPRHGRVRGKSRIVEFEDVDVSFDVYDMPIVGDHEAPHVIMEFADYTSSQMSEDARHAE